MKTCIPCSAQSPDEATSCSNCGEGSWSPGGAAPVPAAPPPPVDPVVPTAPSEADLAIDTTTIAPTGEVSDASSPAPSEAGDALADDASAEQGELVLTGDAGSPAATPKGGKQRGPKGGSKPSGTGPQSN